jgi:lipopolysaccharide/colanic/teichoic acid biosynthesis glycosyltransferase
MLNIAQSSKTASGEVNSRASIQTGGLDIRQAANRGMNVSLAALALLFFLPLMLLVTLAIWCQDRGPVLFAHRRVGRDGRKFCCLKFRSMAIDAEERLHEVLAADPKARAEWEKDHKLRNDPRVTGLGLFLRKSSLDELPQLINVIRGEMDLVGPRPIVDGEIEKYGVRFKHYCAVNPGITGLWQVSGRNDASYRSRVAMDCVYARSKSLPLDLWILIATVPAVLWRKGSY